MTVEQTIDQILSKHAKISKQEIMDRLKKQRQKTNGFIADETLLRMIAAELGVETQNNKTSLPTLSIADLIPSLNDVTVAGKVLAVFPPKAFNGKKSGKFASLIIADKTGILRVVLWNDETSLIESGGVKAGHIMRISHGYTKEGRDGVELHVGKKSHIELNPQNIKTEDCPTVSRFTTKINKITKTDKKVNVAGVVEEVYSASIFARQDSSLGKVMRFTIADDTGKISVVAWNDKADEMEKTLNRKTEVQIVNAKVRKASKGDLEVHVDAGTYIEISSQIERS